MYRYCIPLLIICICFFSLCAAEAGTQWTNINTLKPELLSHALPGAVRFEKSQGPWLIGYDTQNNVVGWVVLSTDVVDLKAYSGKPLITLIGLDTEGVIQGAKVLHHSEPILLLGIPESELHDFADFYIGRKAISPVYVGKGSPDFDMDTVDAISGATVTALVQNSTILDSARGLGIANGVIQEDAKLLGHFVEEEKAWTFKKMLKEKVFGTLRVSEKDIGESEKKDAYVDILFAIADAPQVGLGLLGPNTYKHFMQKLQKDEHLLVVLNNGSGSFKGSGFVRGGIFERIRLDQGLQTLMFTDRDYENLPGVYAQDAPTFKEGAIFICRDGKIDLGKKMEFVFLSSFYDGKGAFSREFHSFRSMYRLPKSVYQLDEEDPEDAVWKQRWRSKQLSIWGLSIILSMLVVLFTARNWMCARKKRLIRIHTAFLAVSVVLFGFYWQAQPSFTQVFTLLSSIVGDWDMRLFLIEPLIFIFWIFIAGILFIWGRGVFCGWVCPYGALSELIHKVARLLKIKNFNLPTGIHKYARSIRYIIAAVLIIMYFYDPILGEQVAEIEPFKTTFFLVPWERDFLFFVWWLLLLVLSVFTFRPFCRYICPLGAFLALPSSFRLRAPRRRNFCSSCNICARKCEPQAIDTKGVIDPRDCLSCMECEANFLDPEVCPPLIGLARLKPGEENEDRRKRLERDVKQK